MTVLDPTHRLRTALESPMRPAPHRLTLVSAKDGSCMHEIHFNNWEPEEGTPLDKWRSIWVESGVAEELPGRNNLKLLLPKSLKDIEGALHNINDIRSTPHGNATFTLRAAVRAAAGGIGDRGRAGGGIGRDRDRDQRYAAAVVVST